MNHQYAKASEYYLKAARHTVDPLVDIYARLNEAKMLKGTGNPKELDKSIDNLLKMARKDKFEVYRDIIYYSAGQLSLQKPDTTYALVYFGKSLKHNENNTSYKNKAFLQMADIAYNRKQYRLAASLYDSLQLSDSTLADRMAQIEARKTALSKIVEAITNVEREDSLQRIAAMAPAERDEFVKKLVRRLLKEKGLKEDANNSGGFNNPFNTQQPQDLFAGNDSKGDWYFYNASIKAKGFNEFRSKWGNRKNIDNWRRIASIASNPNDNNSNGNNPDVKADNKGDNKGNPKEKGKGNIDQPTEISFDELMGHLPLTKEKIAASNEIIANSLISLAKVYKDELDEYELAAATYENYLKRFPDRLLDGEVYLSLYYCYTKLGDKAKADYYKNLLNSKFANTKSAMLLKSPGSGNANIKDPAATKLYEDIYNFFIEGKFDEAIAQKKTADNTYGVNYWTPQLLYIEALYNVRQHNDSVAIAGLQSIINFYPTSNLKEKANNVIDVLRRRKEIESYLTNLQITRDTGDNKIMPILDSQAIKKIVTNKPVIKDSTKNTAPSLTNGVYTLSPTSPHFVLMILDKVDPVYVNEAKNALTRYSNEKFYGQGIKINKDALDAGRNLLVISSFADADAALKYYDKIKKDAANEMSWLPANKYTFLIITDQNLQLLKANKDIMVYKSLLNSQYPNRF